MDMIRKKKINVSNILVCVFLLFSATTLIAQEENNKIKEYKIGAEDVVNVLVYDHTDLSGNYTVGPDGKINIPLIGAQKIAGLTREEIEKMLTEAFKKYLKEPIVTVNIVEYNSLKVNVLGQVNHPGSYSLRGSNTLLEAISKAGGPTQAAQLRNCTITRGTETIIEVDLYKLLYEGDMKLNIYLEPGDTVFVPDNRDTRVFVLGHVNIPGIYDIGHKLTPLEAISKAGGYKDGANLSKVLIIRGDPKAPQILKVDLKKQIEKGIPPSINELQPNDIVYVPRGILSSFNYALDQIFPALRTIILGDAARKALERKEISVGVTTSIP